MDSGGGAPPRTFLCETQVKPANINYSYPSNTTSLQKCQTVPLSITHLKRKTKKKTTNN